MESSASNSFLKSLLFGAFLCFIPVVCWGNLVINSKVVSGNIVQHNTDHSVTLDNGTTYFPSRIGLGVNLPDGEDVSLRYFVETEDKHFFFDWAIGHNSLSELQSSTSQKNVNRKREYQSSGKSSPLQLINGVWQN